MTLKSLLALMTLVLSAGCNTDDLCYRHPHDEDVRVEFDYSDIHGAAPEGMRVWFYSTESEFSQPYDLPADGGMVNLTVGTYHVIAFNNDIEWTTTHSGNHYYSHSATTRQCDILEPMYGPSMRSVGLLIDNSEPVYITPDRLIVANAENRNTANEKVITLRPREFTCHYTFEFRNVGSVKHVRRVSSSISGMCAEVRLADGSLATEPVTLALDAHVGAQRATGNSITGDFYTFGHHPEVTAPHRMALFVELDTGQKIKFTVGDYLDVTGQIHQAADPREVHIVIEGVDLPEPIENGSGFAPGVDDWAVVDTEIKM